MSKVTVAPNHTSRARTAAHHVRKTHKTLKTAVPVFTAAVSLIGAVAMALEGMTGGKAATRKVRTFSADEGLEEDDEEDFEELDEDEEVVRSYSFLGHVMTLLHHFLVAAILLVFVALVVYLVATGGPTVAAVTITILVMAVIWLSELVSRRAS